MTQGFTHKILAVNFGGIGDEVLFLPTLQSIRAHYPSLHITLLLEPRSKSISQVTDLIDATIEFDIKKKPLLFGDLLDLVSLMRSGNFNTVLSSGSSKLVSLLLFLSGIEQRIGYYSGALSKLLLSNTVHLNKNQYAACMYHDLVTGLGIEDLPKLPKIQTNNENINHIKATLFPNTTHGNINKKKILIHPGTSKLAISKGIIKTWDPENWAELISKLIENSDIAVVLAGGPDDDTTIKAISQMLIGKRYISAFGHTKNLADLAALISFCDLLVCVDSAPMHLAVGLEKQLVALFGPTKSEYLLPSNQKFIALQDSTSNKSNKEGVQIEVAKVYQSILKQLQMHSCIASTDNNR